MTMFVRVERGGKSVATVHMCQIIVASSHVCFRCPKIPDFTVWAPKNRNFGSGIEHTALTFREKSIFRRFEMNARRGRGVKFHL